MFQPKPGIGRMLPNQPSYFLPLRGFDMQPGKLATPLSMYDSLGTKLLSVSSL